MDVTQNEVWQIVASGLMEIMLQGLETITPRDTRGTLERDGALPGWLRLEASKTLQYAPSTEAVGRCVGYIADVRYDPRFSDLYLRPVNAAVANGTTLTADAPEEPYSLYVYRWDFVNFQRIGSLAGNSQPGAGVYVLVPESQTAQGLPSGYLTIS